MFKASSSDSEFNRFGVKPYKDPLKGGGRCEGTCNQSDFLIDQLVNLKTLGDGFPSRVHLVSFVYVWTDI